MSTGPRRPKFLDSEFEIHSGKRKLCERFSSKAFKKKLALQLRVPFEVGFLRCGLMASAPDGPGDDESRFDAALDQTPGNATDLLE
jgi:hypothetical protein